MQLDSAESIPSIYLRANFCIFELSTRVVLADILPKAIHIRPEDNKSVINVEQIRAIDDLIHGKQSEDIAIVVEQAELMNESAANAFLKTLEEPGEKIHFVFLVNKINLLLPTIKSRAQVFSIREINQLDTAPDYPSEIMDLAKKYISAVPKDLPKIANAIIGKKDKKDDASVVRQRVLLVVSAAIEIMYKSYFKTGNENFLKKLQQLLETYDAISRNGNAKLQLVAGML